MEREVFKTAIGNSKKVRWIERKRSQRISVKSYQKKTNSTSNWRCFLVNPVQDIYFYGIVLNDNINNINGNGLSVIIIFKSKTREQSIDDFVLDFNNILIGPCTVGKEYWSRGYFYNVGKYDLTCNRPDYGFYSIGRGKYYDEYQTELDYIPVYLGIFGVSTITGIAYEIWIELIIDDNLLK